MFNSTDAGAVVNQRTALALATVFACVRVLASTASTLPLHVYRKTGSGRIRVDGGVAELLDHPAPAVTQSAFTGSLVQSLALAGEAFVGKYRDADGQVAQLGLLPADRIVIALKGGQPLYTYTSPDGSQQDLTTRDVIHVRGAVTTPDGVRGLSPIGACREQLGLESVLRSEASSLYANASIPTGVLKVPAGPQAQEQAENLRKAFEDRHTGSGKGRVGVLTGDLDYIPVSLSPADAQLVETMQWSAQAIASIFGVPPSLLNLPSDSGLTYSTSVQELDRFLKTALGPHLIAIEQALAADDDLFPGNDVYPAFETAALLRGTPSERFAAYATGIAAGFLVPNDARRAEDMPDIKGGDQPRPAPTNSIAQVLAGATSQNGATAPA